MAQFRKRPVVIEAALFDGHLVGDLNPVTGKVIPGTCPYWFPAVTQDVSSKVLAEAKAAEPGHVVGSGERLYIGTLEGTMCASPGDWIIFGVNGELYPCKPDVFAKTYEPAG